jgi:hypothetical protein
MATTRKTQFFWFRSASLCILLCFRFLVATCLNINKVNRFGCARHYRSKADLSFLLMPALITHEMHCILAMSSEILLLSTLTDVLPVFFFLSADWVRPFECCYALFEIGECKNMQVELFGWPMSSPWCWLMIINLWCFHSISRLLLQVMASTARKGLGCYNSQSHHVQSPRCTIAQTIRCMVPWCSAP